MKPSFVDIEIRSYDDRLTHDQHGHAQLVLPVTGAIHLEVAGERGRLDPFHGAVVAAGAWHAQRSSIANRSLILDVDEAILCTGGWAGLLDKPFRDISPAARKLVEFMHLSMEGGTPQTALIHGWMPLLFDTLALGSPQVRSRLSALLTQIEAQPCLPWTTESMAAFVHLSVSRMHALFREELSTSPHAWLLRKRIELACALLAQSNRTIADIALHTGFADQSVLTRAMRQNVDTTPAAYRRQRRETVPKSQ